MKVTCPIPNENETIGYQECKSRVLILRHAGGGAERERAVQGGKLPVVKFASVACNCMIYCTPGKSEFAFITKLTPESDVSVIDSLRINELGWITVQLQSDI